MKKISHFSLALLAAMALGTISTRADAPARAEGGAVTLFVTDSGGNPITPATPLSTPLFGVHSGGLSLTLPNSVEPVTLGDWLTAEVSAHAKCVKKGTQVSMHMSGLIPNGVYTIWVLVFSGPFDPAFTTLVGVGPLGAPDGSQNFFQASASGEGQINVIMPATTLAGAGLSYDTTDCLLDEVEVHLVGVYHSDSMTYGATPGYAHHAEVQFGAQIKLAP